MSRSGYSEDYDYDYDQWAHIRWRGAVASSIRGKRGQAFLRELRDALDALPEKKLVANELEYHGEVCAIGSVGRERGVDMSNIDPENYSEVAATFGIAEPLVQEIVFMNDEGGWGNETPEARFQRMRDWVEALIAKAEAR